MNRTTASTIGRWLGLVFLLTAMPGMAEEAKLTGIGTVDIDGLLQEFKEYQEKNKGYREFFKSRLDWLAQRRLLKTEEWQELDALQGKEIDKLTAEEKARAEELSGLSAIRDKELRDLQGVREPTPEQVTKRQELNDLLKGNRPKMDKMSAKFEQEVRQREQELLKELKGRIDEAIAEVAKAKGLTLVIEKALLRYSLDSLDITKDTLAILNKPAA